MSRRGVYRGVYASMLDDPDYQRLTPPARLVLLTVRLCAAAGPAAIFRAYTAVLAEQTGLELDAVETALAELAASPSSDRPWIHREGPLVWIRNGLRWDPSLRLADPKHLKAVERAIAGLPRLAIVATFCRYYEITCPFGGPGEGLGRPSEDSSPPSTEYRVPNTETEEEYRGSPNGHPIHSGFREVQLP